jgi:ribose/xylose/arabinose/galactoside ABC-type transport system permease subunit
MTYDQPRFRGEPGFREEPDFRADNGLSANFQPAGYPSGDRPTESSLPPVPRQATSDLDDVFDDGEDEQLGADRMVVHLMWELVLLLAVAALGYLLVTRHRAEVVGANRSDLLVFAAALGLLTMGIGLSMRAAAVNLAVGPLAVAAGVFFATHSDSGTPATVGMTLLAAAGVGAITAVLVVGLQVPGWAASLGAAFAVVAWIQQYDGPIRVQTGFDPGANAGFLAGGVAALALVGALLGAVRPIRRAIGRFRPYGDPAWRRGPAAAGLTFLAVTVSGVFAGAAGLLLTTRGDQVTPTDGLPLTALALGAALLGGTSAFGRRGGLFGTLLAVAVVALALRYSEAAELGLSQYTVAAGAILLGLLVTRMVEAFGRPREEDEDDEALEANAPAPRQGGWDTPGGSAAGEDTWGGQGSADTPQWGSR